MIRVRSARKVRKTGQLSVRNRNVARSMDAGPEPWGRTDSVPGRQQPAIAGYRLRAKDTL